jgi:NO-binding membrane sensor protein with MHYT domain
MGKRKQGSATHFVAELAAALDVPLAYRLALSRVGQGVREWAIVASAT